MADGPRALHGDEWEQLDRLVSAVFRPEMFHDYPQLFDEANRENLRVVSEDGKVVTHVGMTERVASLAGCRVDVCCIGAVATYDEYRGRGFASAAFQDCCNKAAADGIDVMLISGGRGLYTRVGCRQVGQNWEFAFAPGQPVSGDTDAMATLVPVTASDIPALRMLHQQESVRFLRPREDWQRAFDCGVVMNTASDFWGVSLAAPGGDDASNAKGKVQNAKSLVAYLICHQPDKVRRRNPDDPRLVRVVEYAGERSAVLAAVPKLLDHYGAGRLTLHVPGTDGALLAHLQQMGIEGAASGSSGTLRVINFAQLLERCRPLLAERIGAAAAGDLRFEADRPPGSAEGGFTICIGSDTLRIPDLASLAEFLFGSPRRESARVEGSAGLAGLMNEALPLPSLWYGINYV